MDDYRYVKVPSSLGESLIPDRSPFLKRCFKHLVMITNELSVSRYFWANVLYVLYSSGMLLIDYGDFAIETDNMLYMIFGAVHIVNAAMYLAVWAECRSTIFSVFCLPDWLNVLGAFIYMTTACMYDRQYTSDDDGASETVYFAWVRVLELLASIIEVVAALGWVGQWYVEWLENEKVVGKGFTLDDPDSWANVTIVIAAVFYLAYNAQLFYNNFNDYDTNTLYIRGDNWYFINSIFYLLASMRDAGAFWFMPTGGILPTPLTYSAEDDDNNYNNNSDDNNDSDGDDNVGDGHDSAKGGSYSVSALNPSAADVTAAPAAAASTITARTYVPPQQVPPARLSAHVLADTSTGGEGGSELDSNRERQSDLTSSVAAAAAVAAASGPQPHSKNRANYSTFA